MTTAFGTPDRANRDELRRLQRERFAMGLTELKRSDLAFKRFNITHEPSGEQYRIYRGEIDAGPTHPASAFYYLPNREVVLLERVSRR